MFRTRNLNFKPNKTGLGFFVKTTKVPASRRHVGQSLTFEKVLKTESACFKIEKIMKTDLSLSKKKSVEIHVDMRRPQKTVQDFL